MYFNTTAKSAVDTAPRLAHHVGEQPRATAEEQAPPAAASTSCVADVCIVVSSRPAAGTLHHHLVSLLRVAGIRPVAAAGRTDRSLLAAAGRALQIQGGLTLRGARAL